MGKKVAKFVGIGMLCVFAVLGIGIGIFALTGGFDQKVVVLESLYFDEETNEVKGKCKLKPYKKYFAFEIREEKKK